MSFPSILQNAIWLPEEDTYLVSTDVAAEPTRHTLKDGLTIGVQGGLEWAQRTDQFIKLGTQGRYQERLLTTDSKWDQVSEQLLAIPPLAREYRPIKDMTVESLQAIAATQTGLPSTVATYWLTQRGLSDVVQSQLALS